MPYGYTRDQIAALLMGQEGQVPGLTGPQAQAARADPNAFLNSDYFAADMRRNPYGDFGDSGGGLGQGPNTSATGPSPTGTGVTPNSIDEAVGPTSVSHTGQPGSPPPAITSQEINAIFGEPGSVPGNPQGGPLGAGVTPGLTGASPMSNVPGYTETGVVPGNPQGNSPPGIYGASPEFGPTPPPGVEQDINAPGVRGDLDPEAMTAYASAQPEGRGGEFGGFGGFGFGGGFGAPEGPEGAGAYGVSGPEGSYGGSFGGGFDGFDGFDGYDGDDDGDDDDDS